MFLSLQDKITLNFTVVLVRSMRRRSRFGNRRSAKRYVNSFAHFFYTNDVQRLLLASKTLLRYKTPIIAAWSFAVMLLSNSLAQPVAVMGNSTTHLPLLPKLL
jgi:hypothetical protein